MHCKGKTKKSLNITEIYRNLNESSVKNEMRSFPFCFDKLSCGRLFADVLHWYDSPESLVKLTKISAIKSLLILINEPFPATHSESPRTITLLCMV